MVTRAPWPTPANRAKLKALLVAEIMGWHDSLKNPAAGRHAGGHQVRRQTRGSNVAEQTQESAAQNKLILNARTKTDGIFTITPAQVDAEHQDAGDSAGPSSPPPSSSTCRIIDEVYQEHPELKASPV